MARIVTFAELIGKRLTSASPRVLIIDDFHVRARAIYGHGPLGAVFEFNAAALGIEWFEQPPASESVLDLVLHELGHHFAGDHLCEDLLPRADQARGLPDPAGAERARAIPRLKLSPTFTPGNRHSTGDCEA
jgi:hypothetical protein